MDNVTGKDILEICKLEKDYEKMINVEDSAGVYPSWWYSVDYSLRKKIINEALSRKSAINELEVVQEIEYKKNINMLFEEYKDFSSKTKKSSSK